MSATHEAVEAIFREEHGRVLAALIRWLGDFELAEDALQEALAAALVAWPRDGVPRRPGAWLLTTARRSAIDVLRRSRTLRRKLAELEAENQWAAPAADAEIEDDLPVPDERLRLIFTCCHPALALEARVALTLRSLAGLTTREIARAFLVSEQAMAQRLVRATRRIRQAGIPFSVPDSEELPERLDGVLGVVYLIFNEGYSPSSGEALMRPELAGEAIRLGRVLVELLPEEPEAEGLLALMLLQWARAGARVSGGELVLLDAQDRSRWDADLRDEGIVRLERALTRRRPGPYQIQAAIAAVHAEAGRPEDTDWPQILVLYEELARRVPSPVVELNRAVALAMVAGPAEGLAALDAVAAPLTNYPPLHAARGELLLRADRRAEAAAAFARAGELARTGVEREHLRRRRAQALSA